MLDRAHDMIENVRDAEQEAYDNLPESLQNAERGERMVECIAHLETVLDDLENTETILSEAFE